MAILKIARMGHPILRTRATPVLDPTAPETARLIDDMTQTLCDSGGVGLAAPQVHVPSRLILVSIPADRCHDGAAVAETVLINPTLTPIGPEMEVGWEACLSIPGLRGQVPRFKRVAWHGVDRHGHAIDGEADGFHARVLQHELDHLDGILYIDRMPELSTLIFTDQVSTFALGQAV